MIAPRKCSRKSANLITQTLNTMSKNPFNLAFRFILELMALASLGIWGYSLSDGALALLGAIFFPLVFMLLWGIFAVRGDPSRSGKTVVDTPGWVRLIIELVLFGLSAWALGAAGYPVLAIIFGAAVIVHYVLSLDRVLWLTKEK